MNLELELSALMQTSRDWARAAATGDLEMTHSHRSVGSFRQTVTALPNCSRGTPAASGIVTRFRSTI
jgi:hypothetical protein